MDARWNELWLHLSEHLVLTGISTVLAVGLGIPLGVLASRRASLRAAVVGIVSILQTIPSLAMLSLLLVLLDRIGAVPAIVALCLYALLPIVRNTIAGFESIPRSIGEAADGLGMSASQKLLIVELPLATPVLMAGVRTAAVVGVGIATLSAFIGAGGLGQFINRGLALARYDLVLLGAIPAALLALLVDGLLGVSSFGLAALQGPKTSASRAVGARLAIAAPLLLVALGMVAHHFGRAADRASEAALAGTIRIGSKNFTEQLLLAEILTQLVEARTALRVRKLANLGGTMICHQALVSGEIDLYVEYTGTAANAILNLAIPHDGGRLMALVRREYRERFDLEWLPPLGFDNTYALAVRDEAAVRRGWSRISDLLPDAKRLEAGFTAEFTERSDGYPGLARAYGLAFGAVHDLEPSLMYGAIARGEVDVIAAFATDGRIAANGLRILEDDRSFFPPYQAAVVARREVVDRLPGLRETLDLLRGRIDDETMRRLNARVDVEGLSIASVARSFLEREGLLDAGDEPAELK
jgi:osmoprotectant transport system substrate-binding protein/osmoprotectant transport system permease protein